MRKQQFRLRHSPLVFVLAQVVMSPVSKIEAFAPDIQERLRRMGFPLREKGVVNRIHFNFDEKRAEMESSSVFRFLSAERDKAVILNEESYSFETSHYTSFDEFRETFRQITQAVHEATKVDLALRIGVRYVNHIAAPYDEVWKYLNAPLLGLPSETLEGDWTPVDRSLRLVDMHASGAMFTTRVQETSNGTYLPADLQGQSALELPQKRPAEPKVFLDLDHYVEKQRAFQSESLTEELMVLHERLADQFLAVTTDEARDEWGYYEVGEGAGEVV